MSPYEVMLSESQERMLLVAQKGREQEVIDLFHHWDLEAVVIGQVTGDGLLRVLDHGQVAAEIPVAALTDDAPVYHRPEAPPPFLEAVRSLDLKSLPLFKDYNAPFLKLLSSPSIASKEWIYRQFDHSVQTNTVVLPGSDAAVLRIKGTAKALAMTTDCNSRYCFLDPYLGGGIAVAEAARNLVCSGARPLALTDCLNFGNPENPEVMWQFRQAVEGISAACRKLAIPVVSGNVSFYNDTRGLSIYPTPIIGMIGLVEDIRRVVRQSFQKTGDAIVMLGKTRTELGGSEYLKEIHHQMRGAPPVLEIELEKKVQAFCLEVIGRDWVRSAHDLSEGGLAVGLAECCLSSGDGRLGAEVVLDPLIHTNGGEPIRMDALLFGESQSRILLTVAGDRIDEVEGLAAKRSVPFQVLGKVGGDRLTIRSGQEQKPLVDLPLDRISEAWRGAIPSYLEGEGRGRGEDDSG
jgi:phosphoribosylformylglycinamidine synthase